MYELQILLRLSVATLIGGIIGWERDNANKAAGFRTHILVSVGSSVVMILGEWYVLRNFSGDATRIAAQVVSGIGFLGAGTIIREGFTIRGLTTAASVWATACLGLAAGAGLYTLATFGTVIVFLALSVFGRIEKNFAKKGAFAQVTIDCESASKIIGKVDSIARDNSFTISRINYGEKKNGLYELKFDLGSKDPSQTCDFNSFAAQVSELHGVKGCQIEEQ